MKNLGILSLLSLKVIPLIFLFMCSRTWIVERLKEDAHLLDVDRKCYM